MTTNYSANGDRIIDEYINISTGGRADTYHYIKAGTDSFSSPGYLYADYVNKYDLPNNDCGLDVSICNFDVNTFDFKVKNSAGQKPGTPNKEQVPGKVEQGVV